MNDDTNRRLGDLSREEQIRRVMADRPEISRAAAERIVDQRPPDLLQPKDPRPTEATG